MFCTGCKKDLVDCTCDDLKVRMDILRGSQHLLMKWCGRCDNHYAVCKCDDPIWTTNKAMVEADKLKN